MTEQDRDSGLREPELTRAIGEVARVVGGELLAGGPKHWAGLSSAIIAALATPDRAGGEGLHEPAPDHAPGCDVFRIAESWEPYGQPRHCDCGFAFWDAKRRGVYNWSATPERAGGEGLDVDALNANTARLLELGARLATPAPPTEEQFHRRNPGGVHCERCREPWPCPWAATPAPPADEP
jgi:hypothetical protein